MADTQTQRLEWRGGFRAARAILPSQFGMGRPDLASWIARITGPDERFGIARQFLDKVYPIVFAKKPVIAFNFDLVHTGDVLEVRGQNSRNAPFSAFYRVEGITDEHVDLVQISATEVWRRTHTERTDTHGDAGGDKEVTKE